VIKTPNSHTTSSSREANRTPQLYRCGLPVAAHTASVPSNPVFPRLCPYTMVLCSILAGAMADLVVCSANCYLSSHSSVVGPSEIGCSLSFVCCDRSSSYIYQANPHSFLSPRSTNTSQASFCSVECIVVLQCMYSRQILTVYTQYSSLGSALKHPP
jgi:hypothetical protein